ncbi:MAG: manno-octulosonate cytidylyltransferase [Pseudomonadota bacterium]
MRVLIVIPARYASARFPGKPLAPLRGATGKEKPLVQRSWEAASAVSGINLVTVATDDDRIAEVARSFGAHVTMTSDQWLNGTERCAEAHAICGGDFDIVVNLQGDAPLTPPWFVEALVEALASDPEAEVATPVLRCSGEMRQSLLADRAAGRVGGTTAVFGSGFQALYFSKEVIPFTSGTYAAEDPTPVFHHVGVYAYRPRALSNYPTWPQGPLEQLEGLEQLRFLENNRRVLCVEVLSQGRPFWELNNPSDSSILETYLRESGLE